MPDGARFRRREVAPQGGGLGGAVALSAAALYLKAQDCAILCYLEVYFQLVLGVGGARTDAGAVGDKRSEGRKATVATLGGGAIKIYQIKKNQIPI